MDFGGFPEYADADWGRAFRLFWALPKADKFPALIFGERHHVEMSVFIAAALDGRLGYGTGASGKMD
jgi:hypothetical protein